MEHFSHRMVQEVVLYHGRAGQHHVLRRGLHPREEGQLDGSPRIRWAGGRPDEPDRLVLLRRARSGRELHCASGDALPEEGTLGVRVRGVPGPDKNVP